MTWGCGIVQYISGRFPDGLENKNITRTAGRPHKVSAGSPMSVDTSYPRYRRMGSSNARKSARERALRNACLVSSTHWAIRIRHGNERRRVYWLPLSANKARTDTDGLVQRAMKVLRFRSLILLQHALINCAAHCEVRDETPLRGTWSQQGTLLLMTRISALRLVANSSGVRC